MIQMRTRVPSPPPERGRSASEASRVGVRFNRTPTKTEKARRLRGEPTIVETRLWAKLRGAQVDGPSFRRQHPAGPYVLDFYCPELRLAVELDGGQHNFDRHALRDRRRDNWLAERGVRTLRFWNVDVVQNLSGVLAVIAATAAERAAKQKTPTRRWRADLPLSGGGGSKQR
jgi:very-short-patch-repair endonuclease